MVRWSNWKICSGGCGLQRHDNNGSSAKEVSVTAEAAAKKVTHRWSVLRRLCLDVASLVSGVHDTLHNNCMTRVWMKCDSGNMQLQRSVE